LNVIVAISILLCRQAGNIKTLYVYKIWNAACTGKGGKERTTARQCGKEAGTKAAAANSAGRQGASVQIRR